MLEGQLGIQHSIPGFNIEEILPRAKEAKMIAWSCDWRRFWLHKAVNTRLLFNKITRNKMQRNM